MNDYAAKYTEILQRIRLFDVFVIAPSMIYAGTFAVLPMFLRFLLWIFGVATALFNGYNFIKVSKRKSTNE